MKKPRGQYHKYTERNRAEVKRLYEKKSISCRDISALLGYPLSTVSYIVYERKYPGKKIKYQKQPGLGIMETEVVEPMPRKISGEDLKKENKDLREEVEYLKDKVAYLEALYEISMKEKAETAQKKEVLCNLYSPHRKRTKKRKEIVCNSRCLSKMLLCTQERAFS